jgi:hypothetical protein
MISLLLFAALTPAIQAECDDVAQLIDAAEQAVIESRTDDAGATLRQAEAALSCAPVPAPALLARMWLAEGTRAYMQSDEKVARLAFAAAARVAPEVWVESYGPQVRKVYDAAAQHDSGVGSVRIHPNPEGWSTTLDGRVVQFPAEAASGLHVVQVGRSAQASEYAEVFFLPRGDTYFILTGLEDTPVTVAQAPTEPVEPAEPTVTEPAEPAVADATPPVEPAQPIPAEPLPEPGPGFDSPILLVVGGAAAVVAGGAAVAAISQNSAMEDEAITLDGLDRAYARQRAFGYTSYGLAGVATVSLGLHFALTF